MTGLTPLQSIASAIGKAEGYGIPGAIPTVANNPGDLVNGDIGYGTLGQGITVYPSAQAGSDALTNQLNLIANGSSANYSPSESISQIGSTWAGSPTWGSNVASTLGVTPSTSFASLLDGTATTGSSGSTASTGAATSTGGIMSTLSSLGSMALFGPTSSGGSYDWSRIAAGAIGLLLIAAGVFSFDRTQQAVTTVVQGATKAKHYAEVAAASAA